VEEQQERSFADLLSGVFAETKQRAHFIRRRPLLSLEFCFQRGKKHFGIFQGHTNFSFPAPSENQIGIKVKRI
jgi:hypothetical protein